MVVDLKICPFEDLLQAHRKKPKGPAEAQHQQMASEESCPVSVLLTAETAICLR